MCDRQAERVVKGRGYQEGLKRSGKKRSRIGVRTRKSEKERAKVRDEVRCLQKVTSFLLVLPLSLPWPSSCPLLSFQLREGCHTHALMSRASKTTQEPKIE